MVNSIIVCFYLFNSCTEGYKESNNRNKEKDMIIEYNFYSSSGGEAIYTVVFKNDTITISNNEMKVAYSEKITSNKKKEIIEVLKKIKKDDNIKADIILDSWRIELKINKILYYNKSGIGINGLPFNIQILLNILTKDSDIKIELYDFS